MNYYNEIKNKLIDNEVYKKVKENNQDEALKLFKELYEFIPLLFKEPNPGPIKYCLSEQGLIESPELRLPLTQISSQLKEKLDRVLKFKTKNKDEK